MLQAAKQARDKQLADIVEQAGQRPQVRIHEYVRNYVFLVIQVMHACL